MHNKCTVKWYYIQLINLYECNMKQNADWSNYSDQMSTLDIRGPYLKTPFEPHGPSHHYRIEGLKGRPKFVLHCPEGCQSIGQQMQFFTSLVENYFLLWARFLYFFFVFQTKNFFFYLFFQTCRLMTKGFLK